MSQAALGYLRFLQDRMKTAASVDDVASEVEKMLRVLEGGEDESSSKNMRKRGSTYYDTLTQNMIEQVKAAESREALIDETIRSIAGDGQDRAGLWYLVLEGYVLADNSIVELGVTSSAGIHPTRLHNFEKEQLSSLAASPFIRNVLISRDTYEFLLTSFVRDHLYFGEFDILLDRQDKGHWLCALPLPPADILRPSRMLIVAYPASGTSDAPTLPRGAMQEWRALSFLRAAYEILNHQLSSTGEAVAQQRKEILADLAPGLVNHEINQQLKVIDVSEKLMNKAIQEIEPLFSEENRSFDTLIKGLLNVTSAVKRLHAIADAFKNLERRKNDTPVSIDMLLSELSTLLNYRLARLGGTLTWSGEEVELLTDASLTEHVLINILTNAIEAMTETPPPDGTTPEISIRYMRAGDDIEITIENNGPPITLARPERLFLKGFTTKERGLGHGLGLHLCRIIMNYLGGDISMIPREDCQPGFNAGFVLRLPISGREADGIPLQEAAS